MSLLEIDDLAFAYGSKPVFQSVGFQVDPGQIFCLVGPNGCGKTTLVHCILTHLKPQAGRILLDGRDIGEYPTRELAGRIAYVPQNHVRSFPYRAVDVVAMGRTREQGFLGSNGDHLAEAEAAMERLGIGHLAQTEYTTLSGGELQMTLIARALVQASDILVLDEPTAHLDVRRAQDVLSVLAQAARDQGKAVVLSTHDFNLPLNLQDEGVDVRMALMDSGHLSDVATPLELLASDWLKAIYDVESRVLEVPTDPTRHFLAVWSETKGR